MQISIPALFLVLAMSPGTLRAASADRVFADGFEPCCRIGGTLGNVVGGGLVLQLNAGSITESLSIPPAPSPRYFAFVQTVPTGSAYSVGIQSQPNDQTCTVGNGSGTVGNTPVDDVTIQCGSPDGMFWDSDRWDADHWQ